MLKKKIRGRISFNLEMLEETKTFIEVNHLSCSLFEEVKSKYSLIIKYSSDITAETENSEVSKLPNWDFFNNKESVSPPRIEFWANIKTIRESSIQIRIYKHTRSGQIHIGDC